MRDTIQSPYLQELKGKIDLTKAPFSDRGSRILIYQNDNQLRLQVAKRSPKITIVSDEHQTIDVKSININFIDNNLNPLQFSAESYPHLIRFQTPAGQYQLGFQNKDTIALELPPARNCGLQIEADLCKPDGESGDLFLRYSSIHKKLTSTVKSFDNQIEISIQSNTNQKNAVFFRIDNDPGNLIHREDFTILTQRAEAKWHNWFASVPSVRNQFHSQYYVAWWVLANNLVAPGGDLLYEALMPSKTKYIGVWNWDACFHSLALRHLDPVLGRNQLRIFIEHQRQNGMLPDAVFDQGIVDWIDHPIEGDVTKPPLMAWAALKLHEIQPNIKFLNEIYPPLCRWNQWWFTSLDDAGLPQYHHPYSSGLDDSPLWDYPFPITSPDLITYLVVQMQSLAEIASLIGKNKHSQSWQEKIPPLVNQLVSELYHQESGYFRARSGKTFINECTPFNFLPVWIKQLPDRVAGKLLSNLQQGGIFWSKYPLQSVSSDSPSFNPNVMWRGPVWVNINYLFIEALRMRGENTLANQLKEETLNLMSYNEGFFEYYHPETGLPPQNAASMFSWSAAVFIDLALERNHSKFDKKEII